MGANENQAPPFFAFRTDVPVDAGHPEWVAFVVVVTACNGILALLSCFKLHQEVKKGRPYDQGTMTLVLLAVCTISQALFYGLDPFYAYQILPPVIAGLLYGIQYWVTDGMLCLATLHLFSVFLPLSQEGEESSRGNKISDSHIIMQTMENAEKEDASKPSFFLLPYPQVFWAVLGLCSVAQILMDILRAVLPKNYVWMNLCRYTYLIVGYLLAFIFLYGLCLSLRLSRSMQTETSERLKDFAYSLSRVLVTCVAIATIELYLVIREMTGDSAEFCAISWIGQGVRLCLYIIIITQRSHLEDAVVNANIGIENKATSCRSGDSNVASSVKNHLQSPDRKELKMAVIIPKMNGSVEEIRFAGPTMNSPLHSEVQTTSSIFRKSLRSKGSSTGQEAAYTPRTFQRVYGFAKKSIVPTSPRDPTQRHVGPIVTDSTCNTGLSSLSSAVTRGTKPLMGSLSGGSARRSGIATTKSVSSGPGTDQVSERDTKELERSSPEEEVEALSTFKVKQQMIESSHLGDVSLEL